MFKCPTSMFYTVWCSVSSTHSTRVNVINNVHVYWLTHSCIFSFLSPSCRHVPIIWAVVNIGRDDNFQWCDLFLFSVLKVAVELSGRALSGSLLLTRLSVDVLKACHAPVSALNEGVCSITGRVLLHLMDVCMFMYSKLMRCCFQVVHLQL